METVHQNAFEDPHLGPLPLGGLLVVLGVLVLVEAPGRVAKYGHIRLVSDVTDDGPLRRVSQRLPSLVLRARQVPEYVLTSLHLHMSRWVQINWI